MSDIEFTQPGYVEVWLGDRYISRHYKQEEATESALRHGIENGPGDYRIVTPDRFVKVKFVVFKRPTTTAPSAPTGLVILSFDAGQAVLDWNNNSEPNLASYKVYHSENGITFDLVATVGVSTYTVTGLAPAVTHHFKVQAVNSVGQESAFSDTVSGADLTPPAIPTGLLVVDTTGTTVTLDWNNNTDTDFAYYRVYRSTNGTTWTLASADLTNSVHVVTGLVSETLYYFHVRATDQSGNESAASSVVTSTTDDITAPANATNFAILASSTTESTLFMTWTASVSSDIAGYKIYRSTDNVTYTLIATLGLVTSYEATGLSPTTLYYFKISAIDEVPNESSQSSAISYTTAPNWITSPTTVPFSQGVASSYDLSQHLTPTAVTITQETGTALSTIGVTIDSPNKQLDYDGVGTGSLTGISLRVASTDPYLTDWNTRIGTAGVQWYHGFTSDTEVSRWRVAGAGEGDGSALVYRRTDDGVGYGGCLEVLTPAGTHTNSAWIRPFPAFSGDPGYTGESDPVNWGSNWYQYRRGLYGHSDYHATGNFVGQDFYIQFRCKRSSSASNAANPVAGKWLYIDLAGGSDQELIVQHFRSSPFRMYTAFGNQANSSLLEPQDSGSGPYSAAQPGGVYTMCTSPSFGGSYDCINCWCEPSDRWITYLIHFIPGRHWDYSGTIAAAIANPSLATTGIQVWKNDPATDPVGTYVKIWDKTNYVWHYGATSPIYGDQYGFNVLTASAFMNGVNSGVEWSRRFAQVIFSTQFIPCPQV